MLHPPENVDPVHRISVKTATLKVVRSPGPSPSQRRNAQAASGRAPHRVFKITRDKIGLHAGWGHGHRRDIRPSQPVGVETHAPHIKARTRDGDPTRGRRKPEAV